MRNNELEVVKTTKHLGLQIDQSLDWKEQIKAVSTKVSRAVGFLKHAKSFLSKETLQTLYTGIVEPHFRYCCSVWGCAGLPDTKQLQKLQNRSLFKNGDAFAKKNYRPITVLPAMSKIYERIISSQIISYINDILSPYLCAYRRGYSTQHALLRLDENCISSPDMKGSAGAILMDLSKAFDCLNHNLLIAKLEAYGFSRSALKLVYNYLSNRKQRVMVNGKFSSWQESVKGIP